MYTRTTEMSSQTFTFINCVEAKILTFKSVKLFAIRFAIFFILNILLVKNLVCIWLLIGQSQSVFVIDCGSKIGLPVDDD